jgi:arylsulfatase A-like enzyme
MIQSPKAVFYNCYIYAMKNQAFITILLFFTFASCKPSKVKILSNDSLPNIILIVADDHGYADMSCIGTLKDVKTPNLDKLASLGTRFTQAYASSPICSPSRMSIQTGVYHQRFGTYWYGGKGIHLPQFKTIAELLKQKNYTTGYIGKVHYGSKDSDTTNRNFPLNHGFDYFFGHTSARKHYLIHNDEIESDFQQVKKSLNKKGQSLRKGALWRNFNRVDTVAFSTTMFGDEARNFVQKNSEKPFFLQLSFNAVHNFTHQLPDEYLKKHNLKGYRDWNPKNEEYYDWYQEGRYPNNPEGRAHYLGQLYYMDLEIGKLLTQLKQLQILDNTLIIYIGDNGGSTPIYANNSPLRGSKYLLYEGGLRVPLMIAQPSRLPQNQISDNVVSGMDILPTICQFANISIPKYVDGMGLMPLLNQENPQLQHDTLYFDTRHEKAIKLKNWKWHQATNDHNAKYEMVEIELGEFLRDLDTDVGEQRDFKNENPRKMEVLKDLHQQWWLSFKLKKN